MTGRRRRIDFLSASLAGLASCLLTCGPARPVPPAPEVEYSGCRTVSFPGPVCALWPRRLPQLKLWVRVDPGAQVEIRMDGRLLDVSGQESQGGLRFKLPLPPQALWLRAWLTVRILRREGQLSRAWSLALVPPGAPQWEEEIKTLSYEESGKRLAELRRTVPPNQREYLFRPLALRALAEGHDDEAASWLRQGIVIDHGEGLLSEEVDKATRLAKIHMDAHRFSDARQILNHLDLTLPVGAPADSRWLVAYYLGLLADHLGDYGSALEKLQQATDLAERGRMDSHLLDSGQVLARIFEELGRSPDSQELFTRLDKISLPKDMTSCAIGTFLTNEAWSLLLAREAGEKVADPLPLLEQAQTLFDGGCGQEQRLNARLNLALAAQQAKRWPEACQFLTEAEAPPLVSAATLEQRLWWLDLKGRQAIAERRPEKALAFYDQLAATAAETKSIEGGFRAAVGRANAQQALGRPAEAVTSFRQADRLIDEQVWHIPPSEGQDTFVGQRESAVRQYLQLLLDLDQRREAFDLVRRDRSRLLRQLEVRDRLTHLTENQQRRWDKSMSRYWTLHARVDRAAKTEDELPGDELKRARERRAAQLEQARKELDRAMADLAGPGDRQESPPSLPGPGEVILAYHPLPKGWAGFAATPEGGVQPAVFDLPEDALAHPNDPKSREILASRLIGPFQSVLQRAVYVRVLPFGPLRDVDFHTLPLAGKPLLERLPVVYGLDLPTQLSRPPAGAPVALLVADPEDNLPEARKESTSFDAKVRGWGQGWTARQLPGQAADAGAVRAALAGATLFEFAGHGELAGFAGWDSALRLAAGSRLTARDILTLRVPPWVVLSTCEGGRSSREAPGEGLGVAQAFLLAGSQAVVAAVRPVRDSTARAFVADLHRYWLPGADLAGPFRQAQLACLEENPGADCESFRLFEP
jgi:cellulose synthase operon protein C